MQTNSDGNAVQQTGSTRVEPRNQVEASASNAVENTLARRRLELRAANRLAGQGIVKSLTSLDSNLKKNTAFIKKLRAGLGADAKDSLVKDIETLSLEKYISEIATATLEGSTRCKTAADFSAATEVISLLHQRFSHSFTPLYGALLYRALQPPLPSAYDSLSAEAVEREESGRISRQRNLMRLAGELYLVEILGTVHDAQKENAFVAASAQLGEDVEMHRRTVARPKGVKATDGDESFIYGVMRDLLIVDKNHESITILIAFVKLHRHQYVSEAIRTTDASKTNGSHKDEGVHGFLVPFELQTKLYRLFSQYFATAARHLLRDYVEIQKQQDRNSEAYIRSGIVHEDRQNKHESFVKAYEKLQTAMQTLADLLDLEMPILKAESTNAATRTIISGGAAGSALSEELASRGEDTLIEDEETRRFYEDLPDLQEHVPSNCLDTKKKGQTSIDVETIALNSSVKDSHASAEPSDNAIKDDPSHTEMSAGPAAKLDTLFTTMQESTSKDRIDQDAMAFALLNSRAARKRLVKHLTAVPKNRLDLLPYYARFVAILHPYMADVTTAVVSHLEEEFRYAQRKKIPELNSLRSRTLRYLAELVKFRLVPDHLTFHIIKVCLDDLAAINIENLCIFLEGCGRHLLRNSETSARMISSLDILLRKKQVQNLDMRYQMMIENAYYQVNPPERQAIVQKERTAMEVYIRKLVYTDLTKRSSDGILRQLRMLPWQQPEVRETLYKVFSKIWKVKYSNIPQMAAIVSELSRYHSEFAVIIVDQVLEDIQIELEMNLFRHNQKRVASIKYLGELFNFRVIDPALLFHTLWQLVTFGHADQLPDPNLSPANDAADDFFRIRLICTLLDTCGIYFEKGSSRRRLEEFVLYFQVYIFSKIPLSMDVSITVDDTFETLPLRLKRASSFDAAMQALLSAYPMPRPGATEALVQEVVEETDSDEAEGDDARATGRLSADEDEDSALLREKDRQTPKGGSVSSEGEGSLSMSDSVSEDEEGLDELASDEADEDDYDEGEDDQNEDPAHRRAREEDEEFARELSRLTSSDGSRRLILGNPKTSLADVSIPRRGANTSTVRQLPPKDEYDGSGKASVPGRQEKEQTEQSTSFTLISRRGNKQSAHDIYIPTESTLAKAAQDARERERREQQQLKKFVLQYEERGQEYVSGASQQVQVGSGQRSNLREHRERMFPAPGARKWGAPSTLDQALREAG